MKQFVRYALLLVLLFCSVAGSNFLYAQAGIFNPSDPVVNYDSTHPPAKPLSGQVGKWVRTPRVSWNTTTYKCYIYNNSGSYIAFRLKYPKNYDSTKAYPILVFLHGLGEYGPTIYDNEYQLFHGGALHSNAVDNGQFDGFLLYPQHINTTGIWSSSNLATVYNLLVKVMIPQGKVDPFRVYVNGLSAGGGAAWTFLNKYTKIVAAATPISNASSAATDSLQKYKFTPVYHFQGGLDTDPSPSQSRTLGNKILAVGGNYKYKEFPTRAHDCWYQAWGDPDYFPFYAHAHKANPWPLFGRTDFCQGDAVGLTLGVSPGMDGYEWRKDGVVISGATSNTIQVTQLGTYDCRVKYGTTWSVWSPNPITIGIKPLTTQPAIVLSGNLSGAIPSLDGSTTVPLEVPDGYATYKWVKEGSTTVLSSTRFLKATTAGNYKIQVTEKFGCGLNTNVVSAASVATRVQAESFTQMTGVQVEPCTDAGGGQDVGNIDLNEWMDYSVNALTSGVYTIKFRLASSAKGAQFEVRGSGGALLTTVTVPYTGGWQKWVDVSSTIPLIGGIQTLRLSSIAAAKWNINYFDLINPAGTSGTSDGYSQPFPVVSPTGSNAPDPAQSVTATALSKTAVQLSWTQTSTPAYNETGFEVYQATASAGPYTFRLKTAANATGVTFNDLNSGTAYYYKVRAVNNYAASAEAGPATATTQADVTPPTTPTGLTVNTGTISRSSIELLWTASTDDVGVAYYDLYVNGVKSYVYGKVTKGTIYNLLPNTSYTFYIIARDLAGNVSAASNQVTGKTTTGTVKQDPTLGGNPANFSVYINMNADNPASSPWNNTNILPSAGTTWSTFKNYAGYTSGVKMTIVNNYSGYNPNGVITGNNSGIYPDNVMRSSYYCDKGQVARVQVYGLSLNHKYSFVFFGSRAGTGDRTSVYKIGNQSVSLNASNNSTQTVQIDNVMPDQNGNVFFEMSLGPTSIFAYLNSLVIKGFSLSGSTTSNQAANTVANALVPEDNSSAATAFPNPVQNEVTVRVPLSRSVPQLTLQLTDGSGSVLRSQTFPNVQQGIWQQRIALNETASQPGVYFLHVTGLPDGKAQVLKIVKVK